MICRFKKLGNVLKETLGIYLDCEVGRHGPALPVLLPVDHHGANPLLQKLGEDLAGPLLVVTPQTLQSLPGSPLS